MYLVVQNHQGEHKILQQKETAIDALQWLGAITHDQGIKWVHMVYDEPHDAYDIAAMRAGQLYLYYIQRARCPYTPKENQ